MTDFVKPTLEAVLDHYGVEYPHKAGWLTISCPVVPEDHPSCRVNLAEGGFMCMACGAKGGDSIALIMQRENVDFLQAKAIAETIPGQREQSTELSPRGRRVLPSRRGSYKPRRRKQ